MIFQYPIFKKIHKRYWSQGKTIPKVIELSEKEFEDFKKAITPKIAILPERQLYFRGIPLKVIKE